MLLKFPRVMKVIKFGVKKAATQVAAFTLWLNLVLIY